MQRREFLSTALAGSASLIPGAQKGGAAGFPVQAGTDLKALHPSPARVARLARLLPGCCAYSYGEYLNLKRPRMTLEDFLRLAVELKLAAVDMTAYYFRSTGPAYLASLRRLAYKSGLAFSGAACGVGLVHAGAEQRRQAQAQVRQWIETADRLGAPHLRVFAGKLPAGHRVSEAIGWVAEGLKAACDFAGRRGIMLGLEDHSGITQNAEVCLEILHRTASPWAGINLDITHFVAASAHDRYRQIEMCAPYATNTHIRDEFDDRTPIDMDRIGRIFQRAGFKGYLSVEYERNSERGEDPLTGVPKLIDKVRQLCEKYSEV